MHQPSKATDHNWHINAPVVNSVKFHLRMVPTIVIAHLKILGFPMGGAYQYRDFFVQFNTMQRKQNSASTFGIQKEN